MKLLTKANLKSLPPLYSTEKLGDDAKATVKFFCPWNSWTWYATEFDPVEGRFFGLVHGLEVEAGYFMLQDLETVRGPWGMKIERDRHFRATPLHELRRDRIISG